MRKLTLCRLAHLWLFFALLYVPSGPVEAAGVYYFDAEKGDDARDGHTPGTAWKSLGQLGAIPLHAGDTVYLKRGSVFQGQLVIAKAMGSKEEPVVVDAYGEGAMPVIDAAATPPGIQVSSCNFVRINNLEITSDGGKTGSSKGSRYGVHFTANQSGEFGHLVASNLYIHDVFGPVQGAGDGIHVEPGENSTLSDIRVEGCRIERTARMGVAARKANDLLILNNRLKDTGGPGIQPNQCRKVTIRGNTVDHSGSTIDPRMHGRGSCAWTMLCWDVLVEHNTFRNAWGINDSCGFHLDIGNRNAVIQYNLSISNAGGFVQVLGKNENCAYRYNISVNDGWRVKGEREAVNNGHILHTSGFTVHYDAVGPFRTYIYNNTVYVKKDNPAAVFSLADTTDGLLVANNIFHMLCPVKNVLINWDKSHAPAGSKIKNVVFTHNLFLAEGKLPKDMPVQDSAPFVGDAGFIRPGGLEAGDYVPGNQALIKDKGIVISKLPNDPTGLKIGLEVKTDILGHPIIGLPDLGAIEMNER